MRRRATLETRPAKEHRSLAEMTGRWRQRAEPYVGTDQRSWVAGLADRNDLPLLHAGDLADEILADAAAVAVQTVAERRATFSRANLLAEVHRQLHGVRFASPEDRIAVAERTTDLATAQSLLISAPELHHTPEHLRRSDGTSRFRAKGHEIYTTATLLEAEGRLLDAGRQTGGPAVARGTVATSDRSQPARSGPPAEHRPGRGRRADRHLGSFTRRPGRPGGDGQIHHDGRAPRRVGSRTRGGIGARAGTLGGSGRGPGRRARHRHGEHGEMALRAPPGGRAAEQSWRPFAASCRSAGASERRRSPVRRRIAAAEDEVARWRLRRGQLVIVEEATLAGTFALDELVTAAGDAGAKVLLVGDQAQLSAVEAGGMFAALVRDRDGLAPELSDVRRFHSAWERRASVELRAGSEDAIDAYEAHDRIVSGDRDEMLDAVFAAWKHDIASGRTSLMIAGDLGTVSELNARARADRISAGQVIDEGVSGRRWRNGGCG